MPAAQTINEAINRQSVYSDRHILPGIKNIAFQHSPLAAIYLGNLLDEMFGGVRMNGEAKRSQVGGLRVDIQHNVSQNTTAKRMAGPWAKYDTTPQDTIRRSQANWTHYSATDTISNYDKLINQGADKIADIVTEQSRVTFSSLLELSVKDVVNGGNGAADAATGLDEIISAGDSVQGLSGATYTNWNSRGVSARGTAPASVSFASGAFASQGVDDMRTAWLNASEGMVQPNVVTTTSDIFAAYEATIVPQERYSAPATTGNASFVALAFKTAPVLWDPFETSGVIRFHNTEACYIKVLSGADFEYDDWVKAGEQEAMSREMMLKFQLCAEDRRLVNKLTGVTT